MVEIYQYCREASVLSIVCSACVLFRRYLCCVVRDFCRRVYLATSPADQCVLLIYYFIPLPVKSYGIGGSTIPTA